MNHALSKSCKGFSTTTITRLTASLSPWINPGQKWVPYSSSSFPSSEAKETQSEELSNSTDVSGVCITEDLKALNNDELKSLIGKFYDGDDEPMPEIFEAILARKLSGVKDEEDDKFMADLDAEFPFENYIKKAENNDEDSDEDGGNDEDDDQ